MEDLLYYIGLGVIATISIVGKVRKEARTQGKKRPNANPIPPPQALERAIQDLQRAAQQMQSQPQPKPQPRKKMVAPRPMPQTMMSRPQTAEYDYQEEAQSLETIIDEIAYAAEYTQSSTANLSQTPKKANEKANKAIVATNTPNQQPASTENRAAVNECSSESSDFDLREAVIYAEILKPKFDEE